MGVTSSSMCTCTSHPSHCSHSEVDDNTISASSVNFVKPPAPSPVNQSSPLCQESFPEGHFIGYGKHRDGSNIGKRHQTSCSFILIISVSNAVYVLAFVCHAVSVFKLFLFQTLCIKYDLYISDVDVNFIVCGYPEIQTKTISNVGI